MRRVLIFSLVYYHKYIGGAEVAIKEITDRIPSEEFEFDLIALNGGGEPREETYGNVRIHRILSGIGMMNKLLYPFVAYRKAVELHKKNHYEIIWPMMASYAGFAAYLFKRKYPAITNILSIQEGDHFERRVGIFKPGYLKIFKAADYIQAISQFLADWSEKMGAQCPIVVVPNAVDVDFFSKRNPDDKLNALKNKLDKKENDVFLVTTSRLTEKNGIADIIESLQFLPSNVKLLILGSGELERELKKKTADLALDHRVNFLGYITRDLMPPYLHVSEIFIRPSLSEGQGISFLEAMAAGIPIIATPVGGIPEFLIDGETGLLCEVKNPKSIAQKVTKLMKDRESYEYITKRGDELVREKYQWGPIAEEMKKLFDKSLA